MSSGAGPAYRYGSGDNAFRMSDYRAFRPHRISIEDAYLQTCPDGTRGKYTESATIISDPLWVGVPGISVQQD